MKTINYQAVRAFERLYYRDENGIEDPYYAMACVAKAYDMEERELERQIWAADVIEMEYFCAV